MAKSRSNTDKAEEAVAAGGSIDQIREILFGTAQRQIETQFSKTEKALKKAASEAEDRLADVKDDLSERLGALDSNLETQIGQVLDKLDAAQTDIEQKLQTAQRELSDNLSALEKQLRQDMADQAKEQRRRLKEVQDDLDNAVARLDEEKTGNQDLGTYLMEIGLRLRGDQNLDAIQASVGGRADSDGEPKA